MRAELLPELAVRAFVEEMEIDVAERGQEAVRIAALPHRRVGVVEAQTIVERQHGAADESRVQIRQAATMARQRHRASVGKHTFDSGRAERERPHDHAVPSVERCRMRTENRVRIRVIAREQAIDLLATTPRCRSRSRLRVRHSAILAVAKQHQ